MQNLPLTEKQIQEIRRDSEKQDWINISCESLTEDFMREFQYKLVWLNITCHQILSEEFIREFQNKLNWSDIAYYQVLSEESILKFFGVKMVNCFEIYSPDYSRLNPSDFIFGFDESIKEVWVYITPKKYWEDNDIADDSNQQPNNLPEFLQCWMEGAYSSTQSLINTKNALINLGFVYDEKFEIWNRSHLLSFI